MNSFTMWDEQIIFADGWFILMDGKGNNSVISHNRARELEHGYQAYQARMDINRGGAPDDAAYPARGFIKENDSYVYKNYHVDRLIYGKLTDIGECLTIPEKVGNIHINCVAREAFKETGSIKKVILHKGIRMIGDSAFYGCSALSEIIMSGGHVKTGSGAFAGTAFFEHSVVYLNNTLIKVSSCESGVFTVKDGTSAIADDALKDCCNISDVILPEGLISIGRHAFHGCSGIKSIKLPGSLCTIGEYAFGDCTQLESISFPKQMNEIGMAAFDKCSSLEKVLLPDGITEIGNALFNKCESLSEVRIPDTVTKIGFNAFYDCGIFKAYENSSESELYIGNWLIHYKWKNIESLDIKEGTVGIGGMNWALPEKLRELKLPSSLKYIGYEAFNHAPVTSVELPHGLEFIDTAAFRATALKNIVIPETVTKIEQWAFMDCEDIEQITIKGKKTEIVDSAITCRRDKIPVCICAPKNSEAEKYCIKDRPQNNFVFKAYTDGFLKRLLKKR